MRRVRHEAVRVQAGTKQILDEQSAQSSSTLLLNLCLKAVSVETERARRMLECDIKSHLVEVDAGGIVDYQASQVGQRRQKYLEEGWVDEVVRSVRSVTLRVEFDCS